MSAAEPLVAPVPDRRVGERRQSHLQLAPSVERRGEISAAARDLGFQTTHQRARCEEQLVETQAAAEHADAVIGRAILEAERLLDQLIAARRAAAAANRSAHLAAGHVSGAAAS